jgi:hypothetical protein
MPEGHRKRLGGLVKRAPPHSEYTTGDQSDLTTLSAIHDAPVVDLGTASASASASASAVKAVAKPEPVQEEASPSTANSSLSASLTTADSSPSTADSSPSTASSQTTADSLNSNSERYDDLSAFADSIKGEETKNPYKDQGESPIFPMQSRLGFQQQILEVYSSFMKIPEYGKAPDYDACKKLGAGAQQELEMYEYQKFVREYVRQASPYRGLLVYHGLGSGKTCSAIAAAEALFSVSNKRIIVMTPFSLRDNFIREISFCGFRHFRLENHWVKVEKSNPTVALFATEILRISPAFMKKASSIWIPDFDQPPNFKSLSTDDRQQIVKQLADQITSKIEFINYNGITASKLKELACRPLDANGNGPFDNAVIVVDEIHNLTRLMQGTIEPYLTSLPGLKRKVPLEPVTAGRWEPALCKKTIDPRRPYLTNYKRGYLLYRLLEGARNSKIIGLSGTPLINFPEEISILVNLLGGYIHTASFTVSPASDVNQKAIREILITHEYIDFQEVKLEGLNIAVLLTCLPDGMRKVVKGVPGIQRVPDNQKTPTIRENVDDVIRRILAKLPGTKVMKQPEYKSEPLLPPIGEEFRNNFLEADGTTLKNKVVLRKRLQGLISYYRGSKKELMPVVTRDELVRVPFTPYAQAEYLRIRGEELKQQEKQKTQKPQGGVAGSAAAGKMGNLWAELYELAKMKSPNSYRMFSRQSCNFAFPEGITRPRPTNQQEAIEELGKEKDIIDGSADSSADADAPSDASAEEQVFESSEAGEGEGAAEAEDEAIDQGEKQEFLADAPSAEKAEEEDSLIIKELAAVPTEGPASAVVVPDETGRKTLTALNAMKQQQAKLQEECKRGYTPGEPYLTATARAKKCLRTFATPRLRLYPPGKKVSAEFAAKVPTDPTRLQKYSPKYAKILESVLESPGSNLVYSQFLDMEGIGIFLVVLEINEFQPIRIELRDGSLKFTPETIKSIERGPGINRFLSFTGGEDRDVRSMALKVFNARFSEESNSFTDLPEEMSNTLVKAGFKGNLHGELCRVFCITSAGAEGLSLRNVRRVHIMEPYWNPVRTDQVKGRAVRICSHIDLNYSDIPEQNERTVEVFTYCSTFAPEALLHPDGTTEFGRIDMTVLGGDGMKPADAAKMGFTVPAGAKDYVVTSDEYLYSLSESKKKLLQSIQELMKTSAVDCQLNLYENSDDGLGCIVIPGTPEQYAFHPDLKKDIAETSTRFSSDIQASSSSASPGGEKALSPSGELPPSTQATQVAPATLTKPKDTNTGTTFTYNKVGYIGVPVTGKGGTALSYDIYLRGDEQRLRKVGTMVADAQGRMTKDIVLFR